MDDASATPSSNVRQSSAPNADFKARATVVIKEVFGAQYLSDWEKAELTAYVASELERDIENYPQKDRDRVKFAQGEVIKRKFH